MAERDEAIGNANAFIEGSAEWEDEARLAKAELAALKTEFPTKAIFDLQEELADLQAMHAELLSYMPKVPIQPYERQLAQELAETKAELDVLKATHAVTAHNLAVLQLEKDYNWEGCELHFRKRISDLEAERNEYAHKFREITGEHPKDLVSIVEVLRIDLERVSAERDSARAMVEMQASQSTVIAALDSVTVERDRERTRAERYKAALEKLSKGNRAPGVLEIAREALKGTK